MTAASGLMSNRGAAATPPLVSPNGWFPAVPIALGSASAGEGYSPYGPSVADDCDRRGGPAVIRWPLQMQVIMLSAHAAR